MGRLFEHFIILETHRIASCAARDTKLYYWRTKDDAEVDLLIESKGRLAAAIEIKQSKKISTVASSGLRSFAQAHPGVRRFIVSRVEGPFELDGIDVLPWKSYFDLLPRIRA